MSVNKALLIGNLGKDPEVRFTASGRAVARFPLATSEVWNDAEGQRQERTEWHNVVVWGKQAETCGQYLATVRRQQRHPRTTTSRSDPTTGPPRPCSPSGRARSPRDRGRACRRGRPPDE